MTCNIKPRSDRAELLRATTLIVWEELPMANKACLHAVDTLLRLLCNTNKPFGGKSFISVGDFRQVAPVVRGGGLSAAIDASVQTSNLWPRFTISKLERPMQNATNLEYCNYVDGIGEDIERTHTIQLQYLERIDTVDAALQWLYPQSVLEDPQQCIQRSFLTTLNASVDELNSVVLQRLSGIAGNNIPIVYSYST
jgi:hypothetical protein